MGNVIPFPPGGRRGSDKRSESAAQPSASQPAADQPPAQQAKELAGALLDQFGGPRAALSAILGDADFEDIFRQHPAVPHAGLTERACFIARVDLDHTKPPIWRRLRLASDLTLTQLHEMLQVALGWTDSHLHHFVMGPGELDRKVQPFLTPFDVEEGDRGILEADVRLDQVLAQPGDRLFYEYDFGDGWEHTIRLESIEAWRDGDPVAACTGGRRACPPEDVGGVGGFGELLEILAGDTADKDPDWVKQLLDWLPPGYDPSAFSLSEVNEQLSAGPLPPLRLWHPMVAELIQHAGGSGLSEVARIIKEIEPYRLSPKETANAVSRYTALLREVGDGITLTAAGYLPPRVVETLWDDLDLDDEWIGKGNREDMTLPVLQLRESATALGLVRKNRGKLLPTAAGRRFASDPQALWQHIASRIPLGRPFERDAGMLALIFIAAAQDWDRESESAGARALADLGWQTRDGGLPQSAYHFSQPTLSVLHSLAGRLTGPQRQLEIASALLARY